MGSAFGQFLQFRFVELRFLLVLAEMRRARRDSVFALYFGVYPLASYGERSVTERASDPTPRTALLLQLARGIFIPLRITAEKREAVGVQGTDKLKTLPQ